MNKIKVELTEDQATELRNVLWHYITGFNISKQQEAFLQRLRTKLAKAKS